MPCIAGGSSSLAQRTKSRFNKSKILIRKEKNMKVLVLYAHPYNKSFNHAILEEVKEGLAEGGHECEVVDLYEIKFDPVLSANDFVLMQQGKVADDVAEQQKKVSWAEAIICIHPIWWENHPAILKGYFDRVFSFGFAYLIDEKTGEAKGLLKVKKAVLITTAGGTEEEAVVDGVDICKRIFADQRTFLYSGINDFVHEVFYNVLMGDDELRKGYLKKARELAKNI
jgi:NAD(P)H dehydrogenase (quinone)